MGFIVIPLLLFIPYALLILRYRSAWQRIAPFSIPRGFSPAKKISVVVAARNEAENIQTCIRSILRQDYPPELLELIVVDDHSTDQTANIISAYHGETVKLIRLQELSEGVSGKKAAIAAGIGVASGEWIVTTDADCQMPSTWIRTLAARMDETSAVFIAAPVRFVDDKGWLHIFQQLDFLSLQGITAASVNDGYHGMCNGANLAYQKKVFEAVGGFEGIDSIASGDDMLLMQKISRRYPGRIAYCLSPDAMVQTLAPKGLRAFLQQRIRWASKSGHYPEKNMFRTLLLVWLFNASILTSAICSVFLGTAMLILTAAIILAKTSVELLFLWPVARFFRMRHRLAWFLPAQPFHILYTVMAGLLGQTRDYEWKGRRLR